MQATLKSTRVGFGQVKHGIAALGIVAALAAGAVTVSTLGNDESTVTPRRSAAVTPQAAPRGQHFIEINQLPEASSVAMVRSAADASLAAQRWQRFYEINMLPETNSVSVPNAAWPAVTQERMRFLEMNRLPGDPVPYAEFLNGKH